MTERKPFAGTVLRNGLWLSAALLVLALGIATQIRQPGLYFDEVFVDYLVVPLVHANAVELPVRLWLPPGNYLFDRFPLLVQLYHGALPVYLGWPLYALLGTDVPAVRIVHGAFAAAILLLVWMVLRRAQVPAWIAGLTAIALALDPAFLFSFRTQYYILLVPLIPFLAGVLLAERARRAHSAHAALWLTAGSGLLTGLACYGYFIYFALAPALAWFASGRDAAPPTRGSRPWVMWLAAFAIGLAPYPLGLLLIATTTGGVEAAQAWLRAYFAGLNSGMEFGGLIERPLHFVLQLRRMLTAEPLTLDVFGTRSIAADGLASLPAGTAEAQFGATIKLAGMLALIAGAVLFFRRDGASAALNRLVAGCFVGLFVMTLVFGKRLLGHHFAPAVALAYLVVASGCAALCRPTPREAIETANTPRWAAAAVAAALLAIAGVNAVNRQAVFDRLAQDGATWMFHPNVSRFAEAARAEAGPPYYFFPDWGLFTSFAMITRGAIPFWTEFVAPRARSNLCAGRDVVVVSTRPGADARIAVWTNEIGWTAPRTEEFKQKDGKRIFMSVRWPARQGPIEGQPCQR